jgi:hypothetical protein
MTQEQKQQAKQIFIECWNDHTIQSKELHTEIKLRLVDAGVIDPGMNLTEESVRISFGKIDEKYMNYRTRPRTSEGLVFDFSENETKIQTPVQEEVSRQEPADF